MNHHHRAGFLFGTMAMIGLTSSLYALDQTSHRLKALNQRLIGIIPDEYTGLIFNPARVAVSDRAIHGKFSSGGNIATLGYANKIYLILGEGGATGSRSQSSVATNATALTSPYVGMSTQEQRRESSNNIYDAIFSIARKSKTREGSFWGVGIYPGGSRVGSLDFFEINSRVSNSNNELLVFNAITNSMADQYNNTHGATIKIGVLKMDSQDVYTETVFSGSYSSSENGTKTSFTSLVDYDPDADQVANHLGLNTNSFFVNERISTRETKQQPSVIGGWGIEKRLRMEKKENFQKGIRMGLSGSYSESDTSIDNKDIDILRRANHTSITITETITKAETSIRQFSNSLYYACGGTWMPLEKLDLTLAFRADGAWTRTETQQANLLPVLTHERRLLDAASASLAVPIAAEYKPFYFLDLRAGWAAVATSTWNREDIERTHFSRTTTRGYTYGYTSDIFTGGLGLKPFSRLSLDFQVSASNLASIHSWLAQVKWLFT